MGINKIVGTYVGIIVTELQFCQKKRSKNVKTATDERIGVDSDAHSHLACVPGAYDFWIGDTWNDSTP